MPLASRVSGSEVKLENVPPWFRHQVLKLRRNPPTHSCDGKEMEPKRIRWAVIYIYIYEGPDLFRTNKTTLFNSTVFRGGPVKLIGKCANFSNLFWQPKTHQNHLPKTKKKGRRIHRNLTNLRGTGAKPNQTCEERQKVRENVFFSMISQWIFNDV